MSRHCTDTMPISNIANYFGLLRANSLQSDCFSFIAVKYSIDYLQFRLKYKICMRGSKGLDVGFKVYSCPTYP